VNSDVGRIVGDGTGVLAVSKADVSALTPAGTPGVTDLPVSTSRGINTDGLDAVVNGGTANRHNATSVGVPRGSIQAHGERTSGLDVGGHLVLTNDGGVTIDGNDLLGQVNLAGTSDAPVRSVGVSSLSDDTTSVLDVLVGDLGPTTVATLGDVGALNDLLRRKSVSGTKSSHGIGLDLLSSREGPAGT
jgi:hypothetical protein